MKFKNQNMQKAAAKIMAFLGLTEIPIADGKVAFDDAASTKLKDHFTEATFNTLIEAFNKDLAESEKAGEIQASINKLLAETDISASDLQKILDDAKAEGKDDSLAVLQAIEKDMIAKKEALEKLINDPENDTPEAQEQRKAAMKHSKTHLFSSNKDYDAIDHSRPWNQAFAKGATASSTDYASEITINKLQGDTELYFRQNPDEIRSLHRDNFELPDFWPKRLNVDDKVSDGTIVTGEITQGRKYGWLPKNVQEIEAEVGQIFPVQIDAEWSGAKLQEIETSWLNKYNKEGSQPEKMSFVRFLVGELMKQARVEDRIASLNGIFVQTPKDATKAGKFLSRMNGLFYQLWWARDVKKKFRAFEMGGITAQNVYDYFHSDDVDNLGFLKRLPQEVISKPNLVVYLHYKVWGWYKAKYKELNGTNMDYKGKPQHFEDYPNIRVETFVDQENPNFVFATFDDNIEILENIPNEKSAFKFQFLKRFIYMMSDYKLGIWLKHIGREVNPNDPEQFKVQSVWSNDQPIFLTERFIPAFDNTTGKVKVDYKNIQVDESWGTAITQFTDTYPGMILKVRGNTGMAASKNIVAAAGKVVLTGGAFDLKLGGTITFVVLSDYSVKELSRVAAVVGGGSTDVNFDSTTINANESGVFRFTGAADKTLAEIEGGAEGKIIKIYGTDTVDIEYTVPDIAGHVVVTGASRVLAQAGDYVELAYVDGVWTEIGALIN